MLINNMRSTICKNKKIIISHSMKFKKNYSRFELLRVFFKGIRTGICIDLWCHLHSHALDLLVMCPPLWYEHCIWANVPYLLLSGFLHDFDIIAVDCFSELWVISVQNMPQNPFPSWRKEITTATSIDRLP